VRLAITSTARSERRIAVAIDRQQLPGAGHATQLDAATILEARARADDQVTHGAGHENVARPCLPEDPRRDVYREPPDIGPQQFALPGVDASADLDAQCLGVSPQGLGAADGLPRAVERGEVAVAGALDHRAAESPLGNHFQGVYNNGQQFRLIRFLQQIFCRQSPSNACSIDGSAGDCGRFPAKRQQTSVLVA
jgi:hypothetical protein